MGQGWKVRLYWDYQSSRSSKHVGDKGSYVLDQDHPSQIRRVRLFGLVVNLGQNQWRSWETAHIFPLEKEGFWIANDFSRWITNADSGDHSALINSIQWRKKDGGAISGPPPLEGRLCKYEARPATVATARMNRGWNKGVRHQDTANARPGWH